MCTQFKEMSEIMTNVVFVKIDVDENPDAAARYNVSAMPTFVFIKGGEVIDRLMGANPARLQELMPWCPQPLSPLSLKLMMLSLAIPMLWRMLLFFYSASVFLSGSRGTSHCVL
jgi:hypothetical protein